MFLKLTSAYGGILLVNMDLIVSVQSRRKTTYKDTAEVPPCLNRTSKVFVFGS